MRNSRRRAEQDGLADSLVLLILERMGVACSQDNTTWGRISK